MHKSTHHRHRSTRLGRWLPSDRKHLNAWLAPTAEVAEKKAAPFHAVILEFQELIGVINRPDTELVSHYFYARLPDQFDAVLHYDHTRAVEPLERSAEWQAGEVEETFPSGL